jgi:hypothetical protein
MRGQHSFDGTASGLSLPLALFYAGLIAYASLYPFHDWQFPGVTPWAFVLTPLPKYWSGFDVAINMLGYIPFGLLLASALNSVAQTRHLCCADCGFIFFCDGSAAKLRITARSV